LFYINLTTHDDACFLDFAQTKNTFDIMGLKWHLTPSYFKSVYAILPHWRLAYLPFVCAFSDSWHQF
jgi:hypothetical protein